jgi:ribonuclease-3
MNMSGNDGVAEVETISPYNSRNCDIQGAELQQILSNYGVCSRFHNLSLYRRAFVHSSYVRVPDEVNRENGVVLADCPEGVMRLRSKSNERLEFLGDGILEAVTKFYLYRRFPRANEGFLTDKKIALVKNTTIGKFAYEVGLYKWFILSESAEEKGMRCNVKKLGCLFEAFVGAIFLDFNRVVIDDTDGWFRNVFVCGPGFQMAQRFIEAVFDKHVNWTDLIANDDNYKNQLQIVLQKRFKVVPTYVLLDRDNPGGSYVMGMFLVIGMEIYDDAAVACVEAVRRDVLNISVDGDERVVDLRDETGVSCSRDENGVYIKLAEIPEVVDGAMCLCLAVAKNKVKKLAEQHCCRMVLEA